MRNESSLVDRRLFLGGLASAGTCAFGHANVAAPHKAGRQIYVSPLGSDGNPGTFSEPLRSISRAFSAVADLGANDSIIVMPGVYAEQVVVTKGGDASGFLTLRSNARHAAKIRSPTNTYSAVNIVSNYVAFEGFDVRAGGSGHGIEATFLGGVRGNDGPHHINITNNISHDNAGSGISLAY